MSSTINHTISNMKNNRIMTEFLFLLLFSISFNHHSIQVYAQKGTATLTANDEVFNRISSRQPSLPAVKSKDDFSPAVSATCRAGIMTIKVETKQNFIGVVHARDYREPQCSGYGENTKITLLRINLLAEEKDKNYCGVFYSQPNSDERSVAVALRTHKTLELVDDKFYMITCGKAGFQNSRNQTSLVNLQLLRNEQKVEQVVYGREYTLRADITDHDGQFGMKVQRCFSFSDTNNTVQLVNERGCPEKNIMSAFRYDIKLGTAEAKLYSMFKFPESNRVHFQCDILVCNELSPKDCEAPVCDYKEKSGRSLEDQEPKSDALLQQPDEGTLMASTSVFVLEPGEQVDVESVCHDCSSGPDWVWPLCITFGILFLVMLIINVFLCSAMTCSCAKSTIEVEKEPSIIEEFDPYTRSWHGSQYGSRYSLNDKIKPIPPPLISVDTSHSISSASENGLPAVYGVPVHPRPSSRYSNRSHRSKRDRSQQPPQSSLQPFQTHSASSSGGSSAQYSKYSNGRMIIK